MSETNKHELASKKVEEQIKWLCVRRHSNIRHEDFEDGLKKLMDIAERAATKAAYERAAKLAESDEDEDQFDAALLKSGADGYSLPRERDWIAKKIRALADEGGEA